MDPPRWARSLPRDGSLWPEESSHSEPCDSNHLSIPSFWPRMGTKAHCFGNWILCVDIVFMCMPGVKRCLLSCQESEFWLNEKYQKCHERGHRKSVLSIPQPLGALLLWAIPKEPCIVVDRIMTPSHPCPPPKKNPHPNLWDLEMDGLKIANQYEPGRLSWII